LKKDRFTIWQKDMSAQITYSASVITTLTLKIRIKPANKKSSTF